MLLSGNYINISERLTVKIIKIDDHGNIEITRTTMVGNKDVHGTVCLSPDKDVSDKIEALMQLIDVSIIRSVSERLRSYEQRAFDNNVEAYLTSK